MTNEHELILQPSISTVVTNNKTLQANLDTLAGKYKLEIALKLSKNALKDIDDQIKSQITNTSNLAVIEDKLNNEYKKQNTELQKRVDLLEKAKKSSFDSGSTSSSKQNQDSMLSFAKQAKEIYSQKIINDEQFDTASEKLNSLKVKLEEVLALPLTGKQAEQMQNTFDKAEFAVGKYNDEVKKASYDIDIINNQIKDFIRNSSAAVQDPKLGPQIKALKDIGEAYAMAATPEKKNELANELTRIKSEAKGAGLSVLSMGDLISSTFKRLLSYNVANMFISGIKTAVQQSIKDIKEIDNQLTQLSKVTDIVKDDFNELTIEALNSANKWGKTASDYLKAVETFAKAGKANYESLAEVSIKFSRSSVNPEAQGCVA